MKVATCLQHVPFEGPGMFRQSLETRGYTVQTTLVPSEGLPAAPGDFLLIMGGPMSVNDSEPWIAEEMAFVQAALLTDIPILGICFGSQLLALAVGGSIAPGPTFEIGMVNVSLTDEGHADSVFSQLPPTFQVIQWHGEGITLPSEIKALVSSPDFPVQAFRVRERCYGLLFHPEIEMSGLQNLCEECPEDLKKGGLSPEIIQSQAHPYLPRLHQFADLLTNYLTQ